MESLPISSFGIQQATACGEPPYFRLKKTILLVIFILSFLGKMYLLVEGEKVIELSEKLDDFNYKMEQAFSLLNESIKGDYDGIQVKQGEVAEKVI